jgi:hypothetical protein
MNQISINSGFSLSTSGMAYRQKIAPVSQDFDNAAAAFFPRETTTIWAHRFALSAGIGAAHYFHSKNPDPDPSRNVRDDPYTTYIDFPNYHSGANGDYHKINVLMNHDLLRRADGSMIEFFPAHPHEGGVGAPDPSAHVIATGTSTATGRDFNLVVAFEHSIDDKGNELGRAIAESSFHHLVDYNWDTDAGCPSFVEEPPGDGYKKNPAALDDIKRYVSNAAGWLSAKAEASMKQAQ